MVSIQPFHSIQQYRRAQLDRAANIGHRRHMDAVASRIVSAVLGVLIVAVIFLWVGFVFAPSWLDHALELISSCC